MWPPYGEGCKTPTSDTSTRNAQHMYTPEASQARRDERMSAPARRFATWALGRAAARGFGERGEGEGGEQGVRMDGCCEARAEARLIIEKHPVPLAHRGRRGERALVPGYLYGRWY